MIYLKAEGTVIENKETINCLKTQTHQGKLHTGLKNGSFEQSTALHIQIWMNP
jgi:hypothetical protein